MSTAPTDSPQEDASPPCQPPETRLVLPAMRLCAEYPWMQFFYSERDAIAAAKERPEDDYLDMRGMALKCVWDENEDVSLRVAEDIVSFDARAREMASSNARARVMDALRAITDLPEHDQATVEELRASIIWLCGAPNFQSLVSGLGLCPVEYERDYDCQPGCSPWKRKHPHTPPPCCPGR